MSPPSFARPLGQHFQFPHPSKQPAFDPKARKNRPEACLGPCVDGSRLSAVAHVAALVGAAPCVRPLSLSSGARMAKAAVVTPAVETAAIGPTRSKSLIRHLIPFNPR